jgi:ribose 1,5-bisphosphokinase PhnN
MTTYYSRLALQAVALRAFLRDAEAAIADHQALGMHSAASDLRDCLLEGHWQLHETLCCLRYGVTQ